MLSSSSTVLVTGGTGFLGRSLVSQLIVSGVAVRVLTRSGHGWSQPNVSVFRGDVTSYSDLKMAVAGCDGIFHCAAEKNDEQKMTATNVTATKLLFELARESDVRFFCHLSSVGVIGKTSLRFVDETTPCNPMNRYEETKLAAEEVVSRGMENGRVVILRPTNVFDVETLRPLLITSLRSKLYEMLKGGDNSHLVFVEDVVASAVYWMHHHTGNAVETFIVSSDEEPGNTHREVHAMLSLLVAGVPPRFMVYAPRFVPHVARLIKNGYSNFGDVVYSSRKLRQAGFNFPYGLRAGLNHAAKSL